MTTPDFAGRDSTAPVSTWPALQELAHARGVATQYWDWHGNESEVSLDTTVAVLAAFGVDAGTEEAVDAALQAAREAPWRRMLPAVVVTRAGSSTTVLVHVAHGDPLSVLVRTEDGREVPAAQTRHDVAPRWIDGQLVGEAAFVLPAELPLGYHRVEARSGQTVQSGLLVTAPDRLALPAALHRPVWGLQTQMYSIRSRHSWGLGDYADLAGLGAFGGEIGAQFMLVNPMHAGEPVPPVQNSPYLPTSRRYLSPLYIRVQDIPEFAYLQGQQRTLLDEHAAAASADNHSAGLLDRQASWRAKLAALDVVHQVPRSVAREVLYQRFLQRDGEALTKFATWCVLAEQFAGTDWPDWPDWARDPESEQVAQLAREHSRRVDFFRWLQWISDEQLAAAQRQALQAGMSIGIITDLAVGVHPHGAEVWTLRSSLATGVTVGAPPDAFNQLGQNWSQPPWRPDRLAELGYGPYREMLQTVLRHAGGLRIDHVMGLFRLWCIPQGRPPAQGAYLRYDYEAMVSILLLEAHRAGAFVVGEDLGVVEPFVRDYLADRGVLGTSILWFEVHDGVPRPPESYRRLCMATVGTHDLPPTAGYLTGEHVKLRDRLGLLTQSLDQEQEFAAAERETFLSMLRARGLLGENASSAETVIALHRFLAQSPALLLGVSVTDMVGDIRTQNQPGTDSEYPNWRIPLTDHAGRPVLLEDLVSHPGALQLAAVMRAEVQTD